jgi:hypothetical protein
MGSLQTEIQKTLNSWGTVQQPADKSVAFRVFDFVQNNPSCSSNDVVRGTGFDLGRASATLLTLYQKGKLDRKPYPNPNPEGKRDTIYHYWTAVNSFSDKGAKRVASKPKKVKASTEKPLPLEDRVLFEMPRMKQVAKENPYENAYVILNNMSIQVASDVYKALKEMFK